MTDNQLSTPTVAQPQSTHPTQGRKTTGGKRQSIIQQQEEESSGSESSSSSSSESESESEEEKKEGVKIKKGKEKGKKRLCSQCKESYDHMKNNCPSAKCTVCQGMGHTATGKCPQKKKRLIHCGLCGEIGHNIGSSKYHTNAERNEFKKKLTKKIQEAGEIDQQIQTLQEQQDDTKDELIKELKKQLKEKNMEIIYLKKQLARHEEQIQDLEDSRQRMMRCFERSEIRTKAREDKLKEEIVKFKVKNFKNHNLYHLWDYLDIIVQKKRIREKRFR